MLGVLKGEAPSSPAAVTVYAGETATEVQHAEIQPIDLEVFGEGTFAMRLSELPSGGAPPGSIVRPLGSRPPTPPSASSRWVFGRRREALDARHSVELMPDYGGVLFRTARGMAPIDYFSARISPELQSALRDWYEDWDESTSTNRWTAEEWVAEGHRLAAELQAVLGSKWDVYYGD